MLSKNKHNYWTLKTAYLIFLFSAVRVYCLKNQNTTLTVGSIRNLTVSIFEDNAVENKIGRLKFNISWLPPANGKPPSSYSILVSSISHQEPENKTSCPKGSLYHTTRDENEFQVLLPKSTFLPEVSELNVQLKCTYKIQVFANPTSNYELETPTKIYTVPQCVGLKCSCEDSQKFLPTPKIETKSLSNGDILIKWKSNSSDSGIHAYSISFGSPLLASKNSLPVYNKTKIVTLPYKKSSFLWQKEANLKYQNSIKGSIIIFINAEDILGCQGNEGYLEMEFPNEESIKRGNITVNKKRSENHHHGRFSQQVLVGLIVTSILLIITLGFLCLRSQKAYNAVLFDNKIPRSRRIELVLQNRNILYVEQETENANEKADHEKYEMSYNRVKIKEEFGRGQFGRVYLATLEGSETQVAVKMSLDDQIDKGEARKKLLEEIENIKSAGSHPHLVGLVGHCTSPKKPVCLILEYVEGGDLLSYLQSLRENLKISEVKNSISSNQRPIITDTSLTSANETLPYFPKDNNWNVFSSVGTYMNIGVNKEPKGENKTVNKVLERSQFLCFAFQIALGMEHLERKKIIHRDLAARNILIDSNCNLKISDFGLSRNGVYIIGNGIGGIRRLPIRWMPPEALQEGAFSSKSDVWSFAVVLWEMGTLGMFPYPSIQDDELLKYILSNKGRLPKPEKIDSDIYNIMDICWSFKPEHRPSFSELISWFNFLREPCCLTDKNTGRSNPCYLLIPSCNRNL